MNIITGRVLIGGALVMAVGCSSPIERRDPTGETLPTVVGTTLEGTTVTMPAEFSGEPVLLFLGYVMEAQFDIDRWLLGVHQLGLDVPLYEIPTIEGLVPGMIAGTIDDGMRKGIPEEDWASVVTVYDDAGELTAFTGTENPRNARVLLLDAKGRVQFFHDRGFSLSTITRLQESWQQIGRTTE